MKRTGPPKKPTNLKLLHGTFRKDRAVTNEAQPETAIPAVPEHLSDEAKVEWGRVSQELCTNKLLSRIDRAALAAYCQAYGRWVKAEKEMTKLESELGISGEVVKAPSGYLVRNEWLNVANKALEQMHKFLTEFGMTPAARGRIQVKPSAEKPNSQWSSFGK